MRATIRCGLILALISGRYRAAASPATAQGCPELLGRWPLGPARTVAVSGTTAYVGSGTALLVVDVVDPRLAAGARGGDPARAGVRGRGGGQLRLRGGRTTPACGWSTSACPRRRSEVGFVDTPGRALAWRRRGATPTWRTAASGSAGDLDRQPLLADRGRLPRHPRACQRRGGGGKLRLRGRRWAAGCG